MMPARSLPLVVILLAAVCSLEARAARVLRQYDIDSLCAMAELIVKVEVGQATDVQTRDGDCAVWEVKVLSTLNGNVAPQTVIRVAGIEEYRKGPGISGGGKGFQRLSKGDVAYLFLLARDSPGGYAKYHLTDAEWKVIESGARLVTRDRVYGFAQYFPPAPSAGPGPGFVTRTENLFPGAPVVSVEAFEERVRTSLQYVRELRRKVSENALSETEKQQVLRGRREVLQREQAHSDYIPRLIHDEPRQPTTPP
jgi:hypothetical protein